MGLDDFIKKQEEEETKEAKRSEGYSPEELEIKMAETKEANNVEFEGVEMLNIDNIPLDDKGVPYLIIAVDDKYIQYLNDLTAMTGLPWYQSMWEGITAYHALIGFTMNKITGDPLYFRRKISDSDSSLKDFKDRMDTEIRAIEARITTIKSYIDDRLTFTNKDGDNDEHVGSDISAEDGHKEANTEDESSEK